MKFSNSNCDGNAKAGVGSAKKSTVSANHHSDHADMLEALAKLLKGEVRRGLNIVDSCVGQLAQAKWIMLNVDRVLEESFIDCPACSVLPLPDDGKKKPVSGNNGVGKQNRLKVLPMVSGHTVQRPKINVTRIEQQRKETVPKPKETTVASSVEVAGPSSSSSVNTPGPSHAVAGPSSAMRAGVKVSSSKQSSSKKHSSKSKSKSKKKKRTSSIANAQSAVGVVESSAPTPSTSRQSNLTNNAGHTPFNAQKKPGPKSKTQGSHLDGLLPPVLTREAGFENESDGQREIKTQTSLASASGIVVPSPYKAPPVLTPFTNTNTSDKLKITSISLKRPDSAVTSIIHTSSPLRTKLSEFYKTDQTKAETISKEQATVPSSAVKRKPDDSEVSSSELEKKPKPSTSQTQPIKKPADNMDDLLQKQFQKFREQQRKKEIQRKAEEKKAANNDVIEIDCEEDRKKPDSTNKNQDGNKNDDGNQGASTEGNRSTNEESMNEMDSFTSINSPQENNPYTGYSNEEQELLPGLCFSPDELRDVGVDVSNIELSVDWRNVVVPNQFEFDNDASASSNQPK